MRTKIKHNTKPSQICTSSVDSPSYITEHHLKLKLSFRKLFQVQSQLNTSPVYGNLVQQEAFKPSQLIPELILALCPKHLRFWIQSGSKSVIFFWKYRLSLVPLSTKNQRGSKMAGLHLCRLGPPGTKNPSYIGPLHFPLILKPKQC